jgi:hypothetical protein
MALFTVDELRREIQAQGIALESLEKTAGTLLEAASRKQSPMVDKSTFDIFLSHAYSDKETVAAIYEILTRQGYSLDVDWIHDPDLDRKVINAETADLLRRRMRQCKSLMYVATPGHQTSNWMPWECGYYDGYDRESSSRTDGRVAIMPVVEKQTRRYEGREYLGLYPYAHLSSRQGRRDLLVCSQTKSSCVNFDAWVEQRLDP